MTMDKLSQSAIEHVREFWPDRLIRQYAWELGPIVDVLPEFRVLCIEPLAKEDPCIFVTNGAQAVDSGARARQEFVMTCPGYNARHIETLAMLAHYYSGKPDKVDIGSPIAIGRPWIEGSDCDHLLVSLPYPYGPKLEWCRRMSGIVVRYLWLLPITKKEADYLMMHGLEELERRLEAKSVDYLDPMRDSVC